MVILLEEKKFGQEEKPHTPLVLNGPPLILPLQCFLSLAVHNSRCASDNPHAAGNEYIRFQSCYRNINKFEKVF